MLSSTSCAWASFSFTGNKTSKMQTPSQVNGCSWFNNGMAGICSSTEQMYGNVHSFIPPTVTVHNFLLGTVDLFITLTRINIIHLGYT
jgi:hypothetical protein